MLPTSVLVSKAKDIILGCFGPTNTSFHIRKSNHRGDLTDVLATTKTLPPTLVVLKTREAIAQLNLQGLDRSSDIASETILPIVMELTHHL